MNEPPSRITGNSVKALNDVEGILEMSSKETAELTAICVPKVNKKNDVFLCLILYNITVVYSGF